ncbi:MAG: hypothetical protein KA855_16795, partial [Zoogloea sp.]|nr:hypothetical protein [Zoogloea sp.]
MSVLQALKSVFYGERFEPADAVQRSLLDRIATLPRLTGILPYLGWMADEGMFVLDQGTFGARSTHSMGFCIETVPQTGSNEE